MPLNGEIMFNAALEPAPNNICSVLLVDDNVEFCELLKDYLSDYGFSLCFAHDGASGINTLEEIKLMGEECNLVLLDLFLPDLNGMEVLRRMRHATAEPIIMLSAHNEETDRILALEMGADDYIPKNLSPRELLARLRAVLRRHGRHAAPGREEAGQNCIRVQGLELDPQSQEARLNEAPLSLTAMEFNILYALASRPGQVMSREDILESMGDRYMGKFDRSIDVHIASLRRKLGDDPRSPQYLKTLRGSGYKFLKQAQ